MIRLWSVRYLFCRNSFDAERRLAHAELSPVADDAEVEIPSMPKGV